MPRHALGRHLIVPAFLAASVLSASVSAEISGYYFRASGLVIDMQNQAKLIDQGDQLDALLAETLEDSGWIDFKTGFGLTAAVGYHFDPAPFAIEIEYAYRSVEPEEYLDSSNNLSADGRLYMHTIGFNGMVDAPEVLGPLGVYGGLGVGVRISSFSLSTVSDTEVSGANLSLSGEGFFWQAMAGLTFSIGDTAQIYGGVRWVDVGEMSNDRMRVDGEMLNYELGFRIFF